MVSLFASGLGNFVRFLRLLPHHCLPLALGAERPFPPVRPRDLALHLFPGRVYVARLWAITASRPAARYRGALLRRRILCGSVFHAQNARRGRKACRPLSLRHLVQKRLALPQKALQSPHLRPCLALRLPQRLGEFHKAGLHMSVRMDEREDEEQALQVLPTECRQQPRRAQSGREGDPRARTKPAARL